MASPVYVMDASSLINLKRYIKPERQWDFFNESMTEMVESGDLLIVPQVEAECGKARHPDVPAPGRLPRPSCLRPTVVSYFDLTAAGEGIHSAAT